MGWAHGCGGRLLVCVWLTPIHFLLRFLFTVYFVYLGVGAFVAAYLQVALWTLTGGPRLCAARLCAAWTPGICTCLLGLGSQPT